jgi:hypothetical protein
MCRNIKTLFNFDPPTTDDEIRAAALQFVRKIAGTRTPAKNNIAVFDDAVEEIFKASKKLLDTMVPNAPPRNRAEFEEKLREKSKLRFRKVG